MAVGHCCDGREYGRVQRRRGGRGRNLSRTPRYRPGGSSFRAGLRSLPSSRWCWERRSRSCPTRAHGFIWPTAHRAARGHRHDHRPRLTSRGLSHVCTGPGAAPAARLHACVRLGARWARQPVAATTQGVSSVPLGRSPVWGTTIGSLVVALLFAAAALTPKHAAHRARGRADLRRRRRARVLRPDRHCCRGGEVASMVCRPRGFADRCVEAPLRRAVIAAVRPGGCGSLLHHRRMAVQPASWRTRRSHDLARVELSALCVGECRLSRVPFDLLRLDLRGDVLRLAAVLLLLVGAAREISRYRRESVAIEERRRVAHDLHDGVAQELAYIATVARRFERTRAFATHAASPTPRSTHSTNPDS